MAAPILVTGGTGTLGRLAVPRLVEAGQQVRVLSRGAREGGFADVEYVTGDLTTGVGVAGAVDGVETILHLAGESKGDEVKAQHLVRAAASARVRHLVYISVVGADRTPVVSGVDRGMFGYVESKRAAELIITESEVPWTTLRATQFHELIFTTVTQLAKLPVIPVPAGIRAQPIAADEVAEQLVELTLGSPVGLVPDLAGPKVYTMGDLIRSYLRASGKHRPLVPLRMPGRAAAAFRAGANLAPARAVGRQTWEEFLAARVGARDSVGSPAR
jgi:uncharacterized protein YbjT (DUF2867 family)